MQNFNFLVHFVFVFSLGFYTILNLQWYSYKIKRVIQNHKKSNWHIFYFILPIIVFYGVREFFWIYLIFAYLPSLFLWYKKIDKKLVTTARVKRFFLFLAILTIIEEFISYKGYGFNGVFVPIVFALAISNLVEKIIFNQYKQKAIKKLSAMSNLKVIAITASFGKTSIKNFLYQLIYQDIKTYKSPKSVNTDIGLIADINNNLPLDTDVYIAEAGARVSGDILKITRILQQDYAIIGNIGEQHIEYFKTLDNIKRTKREILVSPKMKKAFIHESSDIKRDELTVFGKNGDVKIKNISSDLNGTTWQIELNSKTIQLETNLLGSFNANNITAAFLMALELGIKEDRLIKRIKNLKAIPHRLEKIITNEKIIIDDSFNGNIFGILEGVKIASTYSGRKVIVTPGLIEANDEQNIEFAKQINRVFDVIILTNQTNEAILSSHIEHSKRKRIFNKKELEVMLGSVTRSGDLILFANDAPNFL